MSTMGLLASLTLWMYISTTTALSVSGGLQFLLQPLIEQNLSVAQITSIHHIIQGQPLPREDDAQLDLQTCQEDLQGLTSRLELIETENKNKDAEISRLSQILEDEQNCISDPVSAERNEGSDVLTELQKVQEVLQDMQAKDATINHALTTHEAELDRYKDDVAILSGNIEAQNNEIQRQHADQVQFQNTYSDEVATLTGIIQDQQNVIEGLQNFSNTLPDEVATLTGIIQDQQSVIGGLQNFSNILPGEVATLTGKIQNQESVIQGLHNFSNTLPDEIDGLSERIIDQQNQTEWLKMQYDELKKTSDNQCVWPFEIFEYNCYHFNHTEVTWSEARKVCKNRGGDLAVDNFNTLNNFFIAKNPDQYPWIGIRDNLWLNGQPPQQQQWGSGEPSAENQCGCMWSNGLHDGTCHTTLPFICQLY